MLRDRCLLLPRGLAIARGDYIAYLDDDDLYLPRHCSILAATLNAHPEAGFAYSQMQWADGTYLIGTDEPMADHIGTPMIMHRREILSTVPGASPTRGKTGASSSAGCRPGCGGISCRG